MTTATVKNPSQLVNQSSGAVEYYTPKVWTDAAREVMGSIELDPASSLAANLIVMAEQFYSREDDGLSKEWKANTLWMNHPFHRGEKACPKDRSKCKKKACEKRGYHIDEDIPNNLDWVEKLIGEYQNGNVKEAICITFANTSETWFRKLLPFPQCYPNGRVQYYKPDGTIDNNVTKGSCITYLGPNLDKFNAVFKHLGTVKVSM